ncbi:hypothetical protein BJ878DRAFT_539560 [Calycina marina]|uniref:Uncharacterized protein n=1 Tax=Calycina marina TaxID=1763456 RepID=A0A9P7Z8N6_9HELO|nr:hypothetical protein BJ878DRAFT_539560 [Calycina marina]
MGAVDDTGGAGGYGCVLDFQRILYSLVSDDQLLLGPAMVGELFRPQFDQAPEAHLDSLLLIEYRRDIMGVLAGIKMDHSLGGIVTMEYTKGHRSMGSMSLPNVCWWADRTHGVFGAFATQIMPTGDPKILEFLTPLKPRRTRLWNLDREKLDFESVD